jgi:hypothetical protein
MASERRLGLGEGGAGLVDELLGPVELVAVDGPDGVGARPDRPPGGGERDLPGRVLRVEDGASLGGDRRELFGPPQSETA